MNKRTALPPILVLLVATGLLACSRIDKGSYSSAPTPFATFDWFLYQGEHPGNRRADPDTEYENPILAGFYPDPSIARAGEDYYLVASSFAYFPGVPLFKSRDLVDWTQIGHVLERPSQLSIDSLGISRGIFAPTIRYRDGTFFVVTTGVDIGGNFVVTATDPAGEWSDPVWLPEVDGIDPSIFFDEDGRAYMTNNGPPPYEPVYDGHRAIWIQEFDPVRLRTFGPRTVLVDGGVDISKEPVWIEAPHIFKANGLYYLIAAEGGTGDQHSEVVFRSESVTGPYEPFEGNPILTQRHLGPSRPNPVTSTGHADLVQLPDGAWWAVFLGCRPYRDDLYNTGRETFLMPVRWEDGWPIVMAGDEIVPDIVGRPALPAQGPAPAPHRGDFSIRDDFEAPVLAPHWNLIRTPRESWYSLTDRPGHLSILARPVDLGSLGQPSFVGRRQQHSVATATTLMEFAAVAGRARAGIAAFQSEDYFYLMTVGAREDGAEVRLESRIGGVAGIVAQALLEGPGGGDTAGRNEEVADRVDTGDDPVQILLRIEARGALYAFSYAVGTTTGVEPDPEAALWQVLADSVDGTVLSTRRAGGFVGTYFGMFAYRD